MKVNDLAGSVLMVSMFSLTPYWVSVARVPAERLNLDPRVPTVHESYRLQAFGDVDLSSTGVSSILQSHGVPAASIWSEPL